VDVGAESIRVMCPLFQAEEGGSIPTSALQLRLFPIKFVEAKALNALWHSRLPKFTAAQCRVSFGAAFDGLWYAVAIWGRPQARHLPQVEWLELQRFAVASDAPPNTASRLLAVMARSILATFSDVTTLVSYQDTEAHAGTIYRAAGWKATRTSEGGEWTRPSRYSKPVQSGSPKQRWEKVIRREGG
jgi:hypothetical protein